MKNMKKLLLISVIGLMAYSSTMFSENPHKFGLVNYYNFEVVDKKIHDAVVQALEGKTLNILTLPPILQELKTNVMNIIEPQVQAGIDQYVKLNDAFKALDPSRLFELRVAIKKVMTYMPVKTVQYVRSVLAKYALD